MFHLENDSAVLGSYLRSLIKNKYDSIRKFCRAYLEMRDHKNDVSDDEIRKLLNRFSQILKGEKRIQIDDLPYVTELLGVSCEEVLSVGRSRVPVSGHITNYEIAFSQDREVWDRYMKREDKLFLNCDEYCKTVIDYALEFKNYAFIKYLLEEKFIWFVDLSNWDYLGFTFGAGTSVKKRHIGYIDSDAPLEIQYQDKLRLQTIALAIENNDREVLDSLLAREIPEMHSTSIFYPREDYQKKKEPELIQAIALTRNSEIIDYFSDEFKIKNAQKVTNTFVFPFLGEVIEKMLSSGRTREAEAVLRKAIKHNKSVLRRLKALIEEAIIINSQHLGSAYEGYDARVREMTLASMCFDERNHIVSFSYSPTKHKYNGMVSNIVRVNCVPNDMVLRELADELNNVYEEIVSLKGKNENA